MTQVAHSGVFKHAHKTARIRASYSSPTAYLIGPLIVWLPRVVAAQCVTDRNAILKAQI